MCNFTLCVKFYTEDLFYTNYFVWLWQLMCNFTLSAEFNVWICLLFHSVVLQSVCRFTLNLLFALNSEQSFTNDLNNKSESLKRPKNVQPSHSLIKSCSKKGWLQIKTYSGTNKFCSSIFWQSSVNPTSEAGNCCEHSVRTTLRKKLIDIKEKLYYTSIQ